MRTTIAFSFAMLNSFSNAIETTNSQHHAAHAAITSNIAQI
jgi:hypothetical protein